MQFVNFLGGGRSFSTLSGKVHLSLLMLVLAIAASIPLVDVFFGFGSFFGRGGGAGADATGDFGLDLASAVFRDEAGGGSGFFDATLLAIFLASVVTLALAVFTADVAATEATEVLADSIIDAPFRFSSTGLSLGNPLANNPPSPAGAAEAAAVTIPEDDDRFPASDELFAVLLL